MAALVCAASALLFALPAGAADAGALDPSFGAGGIAAVAAHNPLPQDLAIDHRGRSVVGGYQISPGGIYPFLSRLEPDGSLDQGFGFYGVLDYWCDFKGNISGVAIDSADRIVLTGTSMDYNSMARRLCVVRLLGNGELDRGFGEDGKFMLDTSHSATDVAIDREGRILVAAADGLTAIRLTGSGSLDPTFGEGGAASLQLGAESEAQAIATDSSGRAVLVGSATTSRGSEVAIARLNNGGQPDPSFAGSGYETLDFSGAPGGEVATDVVLDPLGRLVLSGGEGFGEMEAALVARLRPDGTLDASFARGGSVLLPVGGPSNATEIAIDRSGRILATGGIRIAMGEAPLGEPFLARLGSEGAIDSSFGAGGVVRGGSTDFDGGSAAVEPPGTAAAAGRRRSPAPPAATCCAGRAGAT